MEQIPQKIEAWTEAEWQAAWTYLPSAPRMWARQQGCSHREALQRAAYFAAGRLLDQDFHVFANGGQPLLKRQRTDWLDEILFHPPANASPGYSPVAVEIMVSFEPVVEIRSKYSRSYASVSPFIAKANIGQFLESGSRVLWNVESDESIREIAELLRHEGLNWLDALCDPISMEDRVIEGSLPFVSDDAGLELVLARSGKAGAKQVVRAWSDDPIRWHHIEVELRKLTQRMGPVYRTENVASNIAVLCLCYDLWSQYRVTML